MIRQRLMTGRRLEQERSMRLIEYAMALVAIAVVVVLAVAR
jgi:uncharacterized membrane protein SirB2